MSRKRRSIVSILLSIVMVVGLLPVNPIVAQADQTALSYSYPVYNNTTQGIGIRAWAASGIKEWKTGQITDYTLVQSSDTAVDWNKDGWYVVQGEVKITDAVTISGNQSSSLSEVHLLLTDGSSLTVSEINIKSAYSNKLYIYGQENGTGKLIVTGVNSDGISVGGSASIVINGGDISVTGGEYGAGIGGSGYMTVINGGTVTANGGKKGAGIGGGNTGNASNIIINGGTVAATGGSEGGAGIGGGVNGGGSNITINGGTITKADGGTAGGAGIGGGYHGDGSSITINGGTVTATGGFYYNSANKSYIAGAGIGGGSGSKASGVTIKGGTVTAIAQSNSSASAIGSGQGSNTASENIFIDYSREVTADGSLIAESKIDTDIASSINQKHNLQIGLKRCTVAYSANGGTGDIPTDGNTYDYGTTVTVQGKPDNLTKTGYIFVGWNTEEDGSGAVSYSKDEQFSISRKATILYAKWIPDHATTDWTYSSTGATLTATCNKQNCEKGSHSVSITLNVPDKTYDKTMYQEATITNAAEWEKTMGKKVPDIIYKKKNGTKLNTAPSEAGEYSASITHEGETITIAFNIAPMKLSVSGTEEPTMEYNGKKIKDVGASAGTCGNLAGMITGDDVALEMVTFTYSSKDVGNNKDVKAHYSLKGSQKGCYVVEDVAMKGNITPSQIRIEANNQESWEGDPLAELTFKLEVWDSMYKAWKEKGLFNGDQFTGKLATNADKDTPGNQYTITQGTLTAGSNYTITTFEGATYTVKEGAAQTLTFAKSQVTKTYGDEKFTETATPGAAAAVTYASNATNVAEVNSATGEVTIKGAGTATITATAQAGGGYKSATASYTLTVNKRNITLTSATEQKDFDATPLKNETITVSGDGYAYGETFAYSGFASQTEVGETDNTFTYSDKDGALTANYNVTAVYGKLKVVAASGLTLTNAGYTGKYDGQAHNYVAKCNIADAVVTYSTDGGGSWSSVIPEIKDVGSVAVKAKAERANFDTVTADFTLKVNKREVTLTSASATKVYDGTPLTDSNVTVSGDGFAGEDGATYTVTGSQTELGTSKNTFTYTLNAGTKADNYSITTVEGDLAVAKKTGPAAPAGLESIAPTTRDGNDGKVTGVNATMEYKIGDAASWTACTGTEITGLSACKVYVRVKETDDTQAGTSAEVTVGAYVGFNVTYENYYGNGTDKVVEVASGSCATRPETPTYTGWTFLGWFKDIAKTIEWIFKGETGDENFKILKDTTIYSKWEQKEYVVSFDGNGGTGTMSSMNTKEQKLTLPQNGFTAPDGYVFAGWGVGSKMGDAKQPGTVVTVIENTTVYAMWLEKTEAATVSFDFESEQTKTRTVMIGTKIDLPTVSKDGYTFKGWSVAQKEGEFDPTAVESPYEVTEDVLFHAIFTETKKIGDKNVEVATIKNETQDLSGEHKDEKEKTVVEELKKNKAVVVASDVYSAVKLTGMEKYLNFVEGADVLTFGLNISLTNINGYAEGSTDEKTVRYMVYPYVLTGKSGAKEKSFLTVDNEDLNGSRIIFRLAIPASVSEKYAKSEHWSEDGKLIETLYLPIQEVTVDGKKEKYVEASASQFSDFVLTFTNEKPADPKPDDPKPDDPKPATPTYDDSSDTTVAKPVKTGTWNDPVTDGTWSQGSDGKWMYKTNAYFRNTWGYIRNPYARAGQPADGWFWFDENGKMLVGWQKINGKWYYLNPKSDGTLGMCFLDTTTPDGYKVDKNGAWIQ